MMRPFSAQEPHSNHTRLHRSMLARWTLHHRTPFPPSRQPTLSVLRMAKDLQATLDNPLRPYTSLRPSILDHQACPSSGWPTATASIARLLPRHVSCAHPFSSDRAKVLHRAVRPTTSPSEAIQQEGSIRAWLVRAYQRDDAVRFPVQAIQVGIRTTALATLYVVINALLRR